MCMVEKKFNIEKIKEMFVLLEKSEEEMNKMII